MKKINFIGTSLLTVMLVMNLTACSSEDNDGKDDNGENNSFAQKYITYREFTDNYPNQDPSSYIATATYDSKNRLIKIIEKIDETSGTLTIDYSNQTMVYIGYIGGKEEEEDGAVLHFKLNNKGFISELVNDQEGERASFTYDNNGYLISSTVTYNDYDSGKKITETTKNEWKDGNLISITSNDNALSTVNYTYSSILNKGNIQPYYGAYDNSFWIMVPSERIADIIISNRLLGNLSKNLPATLVNKEGGDIDVSKFTYQLDKSGYVQTMTSEDTNSDGVPSTESGTFIYKE